MFILDDDDPAKSNDDFSSKQNRKSNSIDFFQSFLSLRLILIHKERNGSVCPTVGRKNLEDIREASS